MRHTTDSNAIHGSRAIRSPRIDANRASSRRRIASSWLFCLVATVGLLGCGNEAHADSEQQRLVDVLRLQPGQTVADVGAGDGDWSVRLAEIVGPGGRVLATEITTELTEEIEENVSGAGLDNVTVILASQETTGLSAACCDAILLRMVYHHFTDPATLRRDLFEALRPGGRIALVETDPQRGWRELEGVPEREGHGILPDEMRRDFESSGFEIVETIDPWPGGNGDPYCLVVRRPLSAR